MNQSYKKSSLPESQAESKGGEGHFQKEDGETNLGVLDSGNEGTKS